MCGIWTRVTANRSPSPNELLYPVAALAHRGPDDYGVYYDQNVAMVHTRLSIIDLSGGRQPLVSYDGQYIGIVNGELYDYQRHRESLISKGIKFQTQSDSEVLLNLFAFEGIKGLEKISGEFSFIFYDVKEQRIFFGRDQHGVKPLFYKNVGGDFTVASEIKALSSEPQELDELYAKRFFIRLLAPPRTSIKDVFHVLPGRLFQYDFKNGQLSWEFFQKLPFSRQRGLSEKEAVEKTRHELFESVKRRLVADVEVGCYLSGGIDSALIAAMMVKAGASPKAFTVGFAEQEFDESKKAAAIAHHLGISHHTVTLEARDFVNYLRRSILAFENLIANPHGAAKNLLASFASQQVKVVLTGEGADEWFGGYAYLRIKKLRDFIASHPKISGDALKQYLVIEKGVSMKHLDGLSNSFEEVIARNFSGKVPAQFGRIPSPRFGRYVTGEPAHELVAHLSKDLNQLFFEETSISASEFTPMDLDLWLGLRTDLLHYILANVGDRQEMSHALEGRTPFLEKNLVHVASQINSRYLLKGLVEKNILRQVGQDLLPQTSVVERKQPFFSPMKYLFQRKIFEEMNEQIRAVKPYAPWLPWKNLEHFLLKTPREIAHQPMGGGIISLRLMIYSMGILATTLNQPQLLSPRGYQIPKTAEDLEQRRVRGNKYGHSIS